MFITVGGLRVRVRELGSGPPIVLVHGIGVTGRYLMPTARALAPRRRVYVPDLPGWGRSDAPPEALGVPALADSLSAILRALALDRPPLLGNSLGCQILIELASRQPTGPLVLVGPTVDRARRTLPQQALALVRDWAREPSLTWIALRDYAAFGPLRFLATARHTVADRPEEKLPRVAAPVLVVRGERDGFIRQEWADEVARLAPDGRSVVVGGAAHAVNFTHPQELARLTLQFLEEVEQSLREIAGPLAHRHVPDTG